MDPNSNAMIQDLIEDIKRNLNEHGALMPTFFIHTGPNPDDAEHPDGTMFVIGMEIEDDNKEALAAAMRKMAVEKNALWTLFVTECYMASFDKDEKPPQGHVRDMPGRIEAVMMVFESQECGYISTSPIKFKADKPVITEVKFEKSSGGHGIFSNLIGRKVA